MQIPPEGINPDVLLEKLEKNKLDDVDWKHGRSWSLVYYAGDQHTEFLKKVYGLYFSENGAGPTLFPSLRKMEAEVVAMVSDLLGGDSSTCGTMTSGGTESILLAIKAYRDWAREHRTEIRYPEILVPESAHPAFLKAAQYFGVEAIPIPLNGEFEVDCASLKDCITDNTICMVASAPSFAQGIIDPISELGTIAQEHGIGLHVDACLGGFLLPFLKKLGYSVPHIGFQVLGVSSMSVDLHKNGYAAKGASAVIYKNFELRRYQFFVSSDWPGGIQASPTMMGTRPGGAIAAAWAAIMVLGEKGYLELAQCTIDTTKKLMDGIIGMPELQILGKPKMSVFSFISHTINIFALGDRIDSKGWRVNRMNCPPSLHVVVTPNHKAVVDEFLVDIGNALEAEDREPTKSAIPQGAILYGGTAKFDADTNIRELMLSRLENNYILKDFTAGIDVGLNRKHDGKE